MFTNIRVLRLRSTNWKSSLIGALVLFVSITQMACVRWTRSVQQLDGVAAYLPNINKPPQVCDVSYPTLWGCLL